MTIPKSWLLPGAVVPVNNETVQRLLNELKTVPDWVKASHFDEFKVTATFNVSVPFDFKGEDRVSAALHEAINVALCDLFRKHNGTYSNPRIELSGVTVKC